MNEATFSDGINMNTIGGGALQVPVAPYSPASAAPAQPDASGKPSQGSSSSVELSPEALALIAKLKARDTEVRQHEQAHLAAAGSLAISGASYVYQRGPDGVSYAVGGEVQIDTSPGRTPEDTIARARAIAAAALAPADPSGPDRAVAAQAQQLAQQALAEQAQQQAAAPLEEAVRRAYGVSEASPPTIQVSA
jgi:hypothetical protein